MAQNVESLTTAAETTEIVDDTSPIPEDYEVGLKSLNQWQLAWRKFRKHKLALIGLGITTVLLLVAIIGPVLMPFSFTDIPDPDQVVTMGRPPFCAVFDAAGRDCQSYALT